MTRSQINKKIEAIDKKIADLQKEQLELHFQQLTMSDRNQQYKEELEWHKDGRKKVQVMVGRVHWKEDFKDEDTGKYITIERSRAVKFDGEWLPAAYR